MQLKLSFSAILTTLLLAISSTHSVGARPTEQNTDIVILPPKRTPHNPYNLHPEIHYQQHVNHAVKRYAHLTRTPGPSTRELRENMRKRVAQVLEDEKARRDLTGVDVDRRQNGGGPVISPISIEAAQDQRITPPEAPSNPNDLGLSDTANDVGYTAEIQVGSNGKTFNVVMDTGSADLWVGGRGCQSQGGRDCGQHTFFNEGDSDSLQISNQSFHVGYAIGQVDGRMVTDTVSVAGLAILEHNFGVSTNESPELAGAAFDGMLGLSRTKFSQQKVPAVFDALVDSGALQRPVVSFKLGRVADGFNDGVMTVGGLDTSRFDSSTFVTVPNISPEGSWEGKMGSITVGGQDVGLQGRTGILDTGTTLIFAPGNDAEAVHRAIPGAQPNGDGSFLIPCDTTTQIAMNFGGRTFAIDPRDMVISPANGDVNGMCRSGIISKQVTGPQAWLLGDVFLKNVYYSIDFRNNQIGLAVPT